jgi:hypothetical protein
MDSILLGLEWGLNPVYVFGRFNYRTSCLLCSHALIVYWFVFNQAVCVDYESGS